MKQSIGWLLCAWLAGCGGEPGVEADDQSSIQGGKRDPGDPAVGLVWLQGGGYCSGSLIAPNIVLTAGHCVRSPLAGFYTGQGKRTTTVGAQPAAGLKLHKIADQAAYPGYDEGAGCPN